MVRRTSFNVYVVSSFIVVVLNFTPQTEQKKSTQPNILSFFRCFKMQPKNKNLSTPQRSTSNSVGPVQRPAATRSIEATTCNATGVVVMMKKSHFCCALCRSRQRHTQTLRRGLGPCVLRSNNPFERRRASSTAKALILS